MKKIGLISAVILCAISTVSFGANLSALNKNQIMKDMEDKTMSTVPLVTLNNQLTSNTVTFYFGKEGKMMGQFATKPDNNDPQNDTGTWKVSSNGTLCVEWQHWNNASPICVNVYGLNNGYLFVNTKTHNFESMALKDSVKGGNQLSS